VSVGKPLRRRRGIRKCDRCFQPITSPKTAYCECDDCYMHVSHLEQCGTCGDMTHQPGPRPLTHCALH